MEKSLKKLISLLMVVICLFTVGCAKQAAENGEEKNFNDPVEQREPPETVTAKVKVEYGAGFSVEYLDGGVKKLVDGEGRTILVVPEGANVPEGAEADEILKLPLENVLVCSITFVSLMRPLDVFDRIKGVTQDKDNWYMDEIKKGIESGEIVFVGGDSMGEPDYELVQALNPDLAMVYTGSFGQYGQIAKFEELGIPYVVINDYTEEDPLGRLEWIKFLAALFNEEEKANIYFAEVEATIDALAHKVAGAEKPKVAWGMVSGGTVYIPSSVSYVAKQIAMAGGDYVFTDIGDVKTGSVQITPEAFYAEAVNADVFIYSSNPLWVPTVDSIVELAPVMEELQVIKEGNVWAFQPWYYEALDKTHEQIEDLVAIFYPDLLPDHQIRHYVHLPRE